MRGRTQAVVAIVIAYVVMVILISPAAPSPQSTDPLKQTVNSPQGFTCFTALLFAIAGTYVAWSRGEDLASLHLPVSDSEFVELIPALRC